MKQFFVRLSSGREIKPNDWPACTTVAQVVHDLRHHHSDPFDRLLIAQALFEPLILLTADKKVSRYSKQIRLV
jgi:PIN domain nuclease of toxin-antitoxin system